MFFRRDLPLAHEEVAPQDSQGSSQGRLCWSLASVSYPVYCGPCRSEGLPPQNRDKQEDLRHARRFPHQRRQVGEEQRLHWLWFGRQVNQSHGRFPSLRRGQAGLHHDQGLLHWTQKEDLDTKKGDKLAFLLQTFNSEHIFFLVG